MFNVLVSIARQRNFNISLSNQFLFHLLSAVINITKTCNSGENSFNVLGHRTRSSEEQSERSESGTDQRTGRQRKVYTN